jgi:hypothetical protein
VSPEERECAQDLLLALRVKQTLNEFYVSPEDVEGQTLLARSKAKADGHVAAALTDYIGGGDG